MLEHQKQGKYYELGGLGPNIGTEQHRKAKARLETINEYSRYIRKANLERKKSNPTLGRAKESALEKIYESVV